MRVMSQCLELEGEGQPSVPIPYVLMQEVQCQ